MTSPNQNSDRNVLICVVVGSSRGLGAELVTALFQAGAETVLGVSRTPADSIADAAQWESMGSYLHLELDIGCEHASTVLEQRVKELPVGQLVVIFNSACLESDVRDDNLIDFDIFERVNRVTIVGLSNTLQAVQSRLLTGGGKIVGISSINAIKPSVIDRLVAYPASKAYLAMAFRSLAVNWRGCVTVSVVHLGHVGGPEHGSLLIRALNPSYRNTAAWLVHKIINDNLKVETTYPLIYRFCYQYLLPNIPDGLYVSALSRILCMTGFIRRWVMPVDKVK